MAKITVTFTITEFCLHTGLSEEELNEIVGLGMIEGMIAELEAMEERQVTVDNATYQLEKPFMVIATQNPVEYEGTYPLPEAQLDRFLMKTSVGYPNREALTRILSSSAHPDRSKSLSAVVASSVVASMADLAAENHIENSVLDYIGALVEGGTALAWRGPMAADSDESESNFTLR